MKRLWVGCGALVLMLAVSLLTWYLSDSMERAVSSKIAQAEYHATAGDWEKAAAAAGEAKAEWDRRQSILEVFASHEPLEDLETMFGDLMLSAGEEDCDSFLRTAFHIRRTAQIAAQAQKLRWSTLF